uniref:LAGLIDADG endonuclease n=1 Tax=Morchella brunnea TaxID=1174671 RepID=A0A8K1I850_9PEZI|nr:LAGLIDADG endonuclease [Morchella brunnea]UBU98579.1 LAGLIDADG endonuclease [Morchella brunnea]
MATWLRFSIGQHSRDRAAPPSLIFFIKKILREGGVLLFESLVNFFKTPARRRGNLPYWALPSNKSWYSTTCVKNGVTKDGNPKGHLKDLNPFYVTGLRRWRRNICCIYLQKRRS